jgi:tRNA nucleotidyltransferase (CCA-adding enzyme)
MPPESRDGSAPSLQAIARHIAERGGRALLVGGSVRDSLLGRSPGDQDVEVLGLDREQLIDALGEFGRPIPIGRSFESVRLPGLDVDFNLAESPELDFAAAARRRDLTLNAIGLDPLSGEILDPLGGRADLLAGRLRASDPARFGEDPLRALRVARLAAQLEMEPDGELTELSAAQDLSAIAPERIFGEFRKLLLGARLPSRGLRFLEQTGLLAHFPQLESLRGVLQDPQWHPEGDVWTHTLMVVDEAAALRQGDEDDLALMFGALCHDMGKPGQTQRDGKRIRARGHDTGGIEAATAFLDAMRSPVKLARKVAGLVEHHLAPALYPRNSAGPRGYRRLARKLERAGVSIELLTRLARADQLGRSTEEARARIFPDGDLFLEQATALGVAQRPPTDVVQGRHLVERGITPGPQFAEILERCRALQDETGEEDPQRILDRVLR